MSQELSALAKSLLSVRNETAMHEGLLTKLAIEQDACERALADRMEAHHKTMLVGEQELYYLTGQGEVEIIPISETAMLPDLAASPRTN